MSPIRRRSPAPSPDPSPTLPLAPVPAQCVLASPEPAVLSPSQDQRPFTPSSVSSSATLNGLDSPLSFNGQQEILLGGHITAEPGSFTAPPELTEYQVYITPGYVQYCVDERYARERM